VTVREGGPQRAADPGAAAQDRSRLTALQGLAALSLDALSSVAYGSEAIVIVLVAAGSAGLEYTVPVTGAIAALLAVLVISYRQVIAAFPNGGGAYAGGASSSARLLRASGPGPPQ
jgi:amino acid transporter